MKKLIAFAAVAALVGTGIGRAADDKSPIKEAMQKGHKSGISGKVTKGEATDAEVKELLAMYEAMAKYKPPKGDEASWKKLSDELIVATKAVAAKDAGAVDKYKKAVNCMACHSVHKPG